MSGPANETAEDLEREDQVRQVLENAWKAKARKLRPALYGVNFAFLRDKALTAWVEIKCRDQHYDPMLIGAAKMMKLKELSAGFGVPSIVVFATEGIWFHVVDPDRTYTVEMGGNSRGQDGDIEPMVQIFKGDLKRIQHA